MGALVPAREGVTAVVRRVDQFLSGSARPPGLGDGRDAVLLGSTGALLLLFGQAFALLPVPEAAGAAVLLHTRGQDQPVFAREFTGEPAEFLVIVRQTGNNAALALAGMVPVCRGCGANAK
jgi:hypothetical protein